MEKGADIHEEEQILGRASDICPQTGNFEQLWRKAGSILTTEQLEAWNQEIEHIYNSGGVSAKKTIQGLWEKPRVHIREI